VEVELSLFATDILHNDVAKTCAELNIPVIAYSPLGRGILMGDIKKFSDIPAGDFRQILPKYQDEALKTNIKRVEAVVDLAKRRGVSPAQVSLAWIRTLSNKPGFPTIIPIPGGTTSDKVTQNMQGSQTLSDEDMEELDEIIKRYEVKGERYPTH
jgi:pyridoxine 4-dehydrogenase